MHNHNNNNNSNSNKKHSNHGAAAKVTNFHRLGEQGTPWHFWVLPLTCFRLPKRYPGGVQCRYQAAHLLRSDCNVRNAIPSQSFSML